MSVCQHSNPVTCWLELIVAIDSRDFLTSIKASARGKRDTLTDGMIPEPSQQQKKAKTNRTGEGGSKSNNMTIKSSSSNAVTRRRDVDSRRPPFYDTYARPFGAREGDGKARAHLLDASTGDKGYDILRNQQISAVHPEFDTARITYEIPDSDDESEQSLSDLDPVCGEKGRGSRRSHTWHSRGAEKFRSQRDSRSSELST